MDEYSMSLHLFSPLIDFNGILDFQYACPTHILLNLQLNSSCFAAFTNGILILISVAIVDFYSRTDFYMLILYLTNLLNSHVSSKRFFFCVFLGVLCVNSRVVYEYEELYFFFLSLHAGSCPD